MGQSITIDVQAKIVGYEQSIKQMQQALQKIDPGSELGQKISKALLGAQKQVQDLSKNMFPKASTDAQVDSIVEKVNRVGNALQSVSSMFQGLNMGDLNFSALGQEFQSIQGQINSLSSSMDAKLNQGLRDAVSNSDQLKSIFTEMGTDMSKATADTLFEDLSKGAKQAAEEATKAETAYKNVTDAVNKKNKALIDAQASPIGTEVKQANIKAEVDSLTKQYNDVMAGLRDTMTKGLTSQLSGTQLDPATFLDSFFSGLTPDNIGKKINALFEQLHTSGIYAARGDKRNFYRDIFGIEASDLNHLVKDINLEGQLQPVADRIHNILGSLGNTLKEKDAWNIRDLIDNKDIDGALTALKSKLGDAIDQTKRKIKNLSQSLEELQEKRKQVEADYENKKITSNQYKDARDELNKQRDAIEKDQREQKKLLEDQQAAADKIAQAELERATSAGLRAGQTAGGAKFPIAEANQYKEAISQIQSREQMLGRAQGLVQRYFSLYAAVRMVSKGFRSMMSTIKELDSTITDIAIVTNKTQPELWDQMPQYTKLARDYASSISGVYKVSQLYYQQGLGQSDVMALTEQTLKMARISGLDYAQATDYMTNAVRSFKMEMTDAQTVVDTYSAVAAKSATSVSELATAMSKTASSAQSVGADIQTTTAMMAVMIEATRESPENIGSAMKSIISRYGELKENKTGMDEEGEEYSLNKVDTALQSVGISIHDANGEFRDFDEVIMELADSWDTIDKNTQRYIATVMAGNRQQSRFLALVSSGARLRELVGEATESEDAAQLQFLKTLDSVDAKTQQLQTSIQSLYVNSGLEDTYKNVLDLSNNIVASLDNLAQNNGLSMALTKIGTTFSTVALLVTNLFNTMKTRYANTRMAMTAQAKVSAEEELIAQKQALLKAGKFKNDEERQKTQAALEGAEERKQIYEKEAKYYQKAPVSSKKMTRGMALSGVGMAMTTIGASLEDTKDTRPWKAGLTGVGGILSGIGTGMMLGGPAGILMGIVTAIPNIIEAFGLLSQSTEEKVSELEKSVDDANNARIESRSELKTLEDYKKKYDELSAAQYDSNEKKQEFIKLQNEIAERYPELIKGMTSEGDYLVNMAEGYERLAEAKRSAYKEDIIESIAAETAGIKDADYVLQNIYGQTPIQNTKAWHGLFDTSAAAQLMQIDYTQFSGEEKNQVYDALKNKETANQIFSNLKTAEGTPVDFMSIDNDLAIHLFTVYSSFIDKIKENKSYAQAADEIEAELGESFKTWIDAFSPEAFKELKTRTNIPEYQSQLLESQTNAYHTELVNLLANQTDETFDIASNDIQKRFAQEQMSRDFSEWEKNLDKKTKSDPEKWKEAVKNFYAQYDAVWYRLERESEYMTGLTDEQNQFYQQLGQHTEADLEKMFPTQDTKGLEGEELEAAEAINKRNDFIREIFKKDYKSIFDNYDEWMETEDVKNFGVENYRNKFGPEFLKQIQSLYSGVLSNEKMGDAQKQLQVQALNNINNILSSDIFTFDERNALLGKVSAADLTSLNGIYSLIEGIGKLELDGDITGLVEGLKNLGQLLSINLSTEIDTYYDTIEKSVDDFNKAVNSVTQGTDLKTARSIADKMGKSLNEFEVRDGKFYFDDIDALREAYIKSNDEYIADVKSNIKDRYQGLEKLSEISVDENTKLKINGKDILSGKSDLKDLENLLSTEKAKLAFQQETGISASDFLQYYEDFQAQLDTGTNDFVEFMLSQVDSKLSESGEAILQYLEQSSKISAKSQLKAGDITGFLKTTGIMKSSDALRKEAAKAIESDAQKMAEIQQKADQAKQDYLDSIAEDLKESNPYTLAQEMYAKGAGKGQAFEKDIRARAEAMAKAAEIENKARLSEFPNKSEMLQSYLGQATGDIKDAYAKEGKSARTLNEIRAEAAQLAQDNAIANVQIANDFMKSKDHLSEEAQSYIDSGEALSKLTSSSKYYTEETKQKAWEDIYSKTMNSWDEFESWFDLTHTKITDDVVNAQAESMANDAKRINQQRLNDLLKNDNVDSLTRKLTREFEQSGGHLISNTEIEERAVEYAREAKKLNDAWLEANLKETDPKKIYDELASQYEGIKTDDEILEEANQQAEKNAAANKELQELVLETMKPEYWMDQATEEYKKQLEKEQESAYSELIASIGHGEIDNLPADLREFAADIYEIYGGVQSSIMNNMMTAIEGGSNKIKVTAENASILNDYVKAGLIKGHVRTDEQGNVVYDEAGNFPIIDALKKGDLAEINVQKLRSMQDEDFYNLVNSIETDEQNKSKLIDQFLNIKYPDIVSSTTGLAEKTSLTRDEFQNHLKNMGIAAEELNQNDSFQKYVDQYGLVFDSATNTYQVLDENYNQYINQLEKDLEGASDSTAKTEAQIKLSAARRTHANKKVGAQVKAFQDVISNYSKVTDDQITALQESLSDGEWEKIEDYITPLGTGEYKLDVGGLKSHLSELGLSEKVQEAILGMFDSIADDYLKNITTATSMVTQGTTNQADIQKFIAGAKQLGVDAESAFSYDSILNAWTLNATTMGKYIQAQAQQLVDDGLLSADEVNEYVNKNVSQVLAGAVDIKSFLDSENKQGQAREKLVKQLANIIDPRQLLYEQYLKEEEANYGANSTELKQAVHAKVADASQETLKAAQDKYVESLISTIEEGGIAAVNIMQAVAIASGKELTSAEIESAYKAQVSQIEKASEQLSLGVGSLVTGNAIQILQNAGYKLQSMGDGNTAVIEQIGQISDAYAAYYQALKDSGEATLEALNNAKAKVLETKNGRDAEQHAIDALGDAAGMTYSTFGQLLTDMGIELTDDLINELESSGITESMGGNKMRIKDFAGFARRMDWDFNSEEYLSAFSSFNDGLVEQGRKNRTQATDELDKLKEAKPGDLLNLTYMTEQFKKYSEKQSKKISKDGTYKSFYETLQDNVASYGGVLADGLLELTDTANLWGIAETLQTAAIDSGSTMVGQLADMVQSVITSYTDAIVKGMQGGMTNEEASNLIQKGHDLGYTSLSDKDFIKTTEGLQLSSAAAISLYTAMSQTNELQGKILFKDLSESLQKNNDNYKTQTSLITHIAKLQKKYNALNEKQTKEQDKQIDKIKEAKKQLKEELAVAKEISQTDLKDKDKDWNFMNNDATPADLDNAMEYWSGWGQAMSNMDKWANDGYADVDSFLALVQHAQEVADGTTGSFKILGTEIGTAGKYTYEMIKDILPQVMTLNSKTGEWQISAQKLSKYGINLLSGQAGFGKESRAQLQSYMHELSLANDSLDVFFDGLGEVQSMMSDNDMSFEDYVDKTAGTETFNYDKFTADLKKRAGALKYFNEFTEQIEVNGETWDKISKKMKKNEAGYETMQSIIDMAVNGQWSEGTDYQVIASNLKNSRFNGKIKLYGRTYISQKGEVIVEYEEDGETKYKSSTGEDLGNNQEKAFEKLRQKQLDAFAEKYDKYSSSSKGETSITVDGTTYTVTIKGDKYVITYEENGETKTTSVDNGSEIESKIKSIAGKENMSDEAYTLKVQRETMKEKYGTEGPATMTGESRISSSTRDWIQANGITSGQDIVNAFDQFMGQLPDGVNWNDGLIEWEVETGLKVDAPKQGHIKVDDANKWYEQSQLTQTAADVAAGIEEALNGDLSAAIGEAIGNAFSAEGVDVGNLKLNPESLSLDTEGVSTQSIGDIEIQAGNLTIKPSSVTVDDSGKDSKSESDKATEEEITVTKNYVTGTIDEPDISDEERDVNWQNQYKGPPEVSDISKTIYWNNVQTGEKPSGGVVSAQGTVGLAHAKSTLMGELGPEMVVSNGRYFVVGQNGPEMVDLDDDAIVFNHLQTQSLLSKGTSSTRGRAITNERNAVAYAHGNINGGIALDNGLQGRRGTRGVIDALGEATMNKIAKSAETVAETLEAFVKELDRWYTQLQKIAAIEEKIAYQEALRSKISSDFYASGHDYYTSQLTSLEEYGKLIASDRALIDQRSAYVSQRVSTLTSSNSPWSALYTVDSNGTMIYNQNAYDVFSEKFGASDTGAPNYNAQEQYNWLMEHGFGEYLKYDKNGNEIKLTNDKGETDTKAYKNAVEAFWDKMESQRDEIQEELDDIAERERAILEAQERANEIAQEMRDNQIELENKVLDAVVEIRERAISELEKQRDAYADSADKTVNGLTDALNKERQMYEMQDTQAETDRMRRRLAILQSSGGSASEIIDLQEQIRQRDRDMYFDQSQKQIDAIKEASDKEIERMDSQIELQKELLEYQKAHGLLWEAVYEVMRQTPDQITAFIAENTEEFWSYSPAKSAKEFAELNFKSEQWADFRDKYGADLDKVIELLTSAIAAISAQQAAASDGGAGSTGGTWKQDEVGWWYEHADGSYTTNDWEKIDGKWYWFNEKGYMHTGWHQWNGGWYYLDPTQGDLKTGWIQWNGGWYYADENGKLLQNTSQTIDGKNYTFDANGLAREGGSGGGTAKANNTVEWKYDGSKYQKYVNGQATGEYSYEDPNKRIKNTQITDNEMVSADVGGMIDKDQFIFVHANEAVLTPYQTSILRNQILGGGRNSLMNLLLAFRDMYDSFGTGSSYGMYDGGDGSVNIEHAELNMYVNEIANDYDARRAGEQALDEMLRIARRTSVMGLRR